MSQRPGLSVSGIGKSINTREVINGAPLFGDKATPAEYGAGLKFAIDKGWIELHESGTFVKFTQRGAELFA